MSTFVLVHGAFHGAWSWYKIVSLLEGAGHRVIARDLPGHGARARLGEKCSLKAYAESVCEIIDSAPEPVILVGHSMAGAVISQAGEWRPECVRKLVFIAAFLLGDGQSVRSFSKPGAHNALYDNLIWSDDRQYASLKSGKFADAFCHDAPHAETALCELLQMPQFMAPSGEPVSLSGDAFGKIPRVYIECAQDRSLLLEVQQAMHAASPCERIVRLETSHSPMLSRPDDLAEVLLDLVE